MKQMTGECIRVAAARSVPADKPLRMKNIHNIRKKRRGREPT